MYLVGYSLDNLSLMALTISTGFVVDDAIVVIENITRYREQGKSPLEAALERSTGSRLHRVVDEPLAGGRVHSAPADERHRRPVVPRVRGHDGDGDRDLDGRVADSHADDVRASPQGRGAARPVVPVERTRLSFGHQRLRPHARRRAAIRDRDAARPDRHDRADGFPLRARAERVFSRSRTPGG